MTPPLTTNAGLVLAKSRRPLAAATGSPLTNATAVGPARRAATPSSPALFAAILVSVFFTIEYVVSAPRARRRSLICLTVRPRYSVRSAALEVRKLSVSWATASPLSGRTLARLCSTGVTVSVAMGSFRTGAGHPTNDKAPRRRSARGVKSRCEHRIWPCHLRGSPAEAEHCAETPSQEQQRPAVLGCGITLPAGWRGVRPPRHPQAGCGFYSGRPGRQGPWSS